MVSLRACLPGALAILVALIPAPLLAQSPTQLSGSWTLNRQSSDSPTDVGFSTNFLTPNGPGDVDFNGAGRRRDGGGRIASKPIKPETPDDAQRVLTLTDEVRTPYEQFTMEVTPAAVTITPDRAPARVFHPGRRDELINLGRVSTAATAMWDGQRLDIVYDAEPGRTVHYTYTLTQSPRLLSVEVEFVERGSGAGDKVRRVYIPTPPPESRSTASAPASPSPTAPAAAPPAAPPANASAPSSVPAAPPAPSAPAEAIDQRPDAPLKGLTRLGVVVEELSPDAVKCGLKSGTIDTEVGKHLTDAGLRVIRNSDDDTYLYVNVNTVMASNGLCVSRYDVTLYSHTAAKLSYSAAPVLLQVELLHKGGIAGGGPAAHADGVMKGVAEYVDQFATRVRDANK